MRRHCGERRPTELADPLDGAEWLAGVARTVSAEGTLNLREDLRFVVVLALQSLTTRQPAAIVLHEVCDHSLEEIGLVSAIKNV